MTAQDFANLIGDALYEYESDDLDVSSIMTFEDRMLLTHDKGIVVKAADGTEYQVAVNVRN